MSYHKSLKDIPLLFKIKGCFNPVYLLYYYKYRLIACFSHQGNSSVYKYTFRVPFWQGSFTLEVVMDRKCTWVLVFSIYNAPAETQGPFI